MFTYSVFLAQVLGFESVQNYFVCLYGLFLPDSGCKWKQEKQQCQASLTLFNAPKRSIDYQKSLEKTLGTYTSLFSIFRLDNFKTNNKTPNICDTGHSLPCLLFGAFCHLKIFTDSTFKSDYALPSVLNQKPRVYDWGSLREYITVKLLSNLI